MTSCDIDIEACMVNVALLICIMNHERVIVLLDDYYVFVVRCSMM